MAAPTYHFWIKPTGEPYALFAGIIRDLARQLGVQPFEPHVTLLGYLEGTEAEHVQRARELSALLRPYEMTLTEPAWLDEHFRSLFMIVAQTPEVMNVHAEALAMYGRSGEAYTPHLSLVYGMLPEDVKRSVVATLPPGVRTSFTVRSLILLRSESMEPADWHEILELPFRD